MSIYKYFIHFIELFFPKICAACGNNLIQSEKILCTECNYKLPKTNYQIDPNNNKICKLFWGIVDISYATSYFHFFKGSKYQKVIHKFKYNGVQKIGFELGKDFGYVLRDSIFSEIDYIIPVPLHPIKFRRRGFNQSEIIANGISKSLNKKVLNKILIRKVHTDTQTKKTIEERRKNVESVFGIKNPHIIANKHILLIDDVITTGSTLSSCAKEILKIKNTKVSIATLAVTTH